MSFSIVSRCREQVLLLENALLGARFPLFRARHREYFLESKKGALESAQDRPPSAKLSPLLDRREVTMMATSRFDVHQH